MDKRRIHLVVMVGNKEKVQSFVSNLRKDHKEHGINIRYIDMNADEEGKDFYKFSVDISSGMALRSIDE